MADDASTHRLIARVGKALYGDEIWKGPLARETGIRKTSIDDMEKGRAETPIGVYERLLAMAEARLALLQRAVADLRATIERRRS